MIAQQPRATDIPAPKQQLLNLNYIQNKPSPHQCGYCKKEGSLSWGLTKQIMHPLTYELMIEKGWRRCGTYYYKPDIKNSCCKLWTHRLDVNMFKIKKDQKKTVRNVAEWLMSKMEGKGTNKDKQKGREIEKMNQQGKKKVQDKKQANKQNIKKQQLQKQNIKKQQPQKQKPQKINPEIPPSFLALSSKLVSSIAQNLSAQLLKLFKTLAPNLIPSQIPPQQLSHHFQYQFPSQKIKIFLPQNNTTSECDFYNNYVMLLYGCNKKLFKKEYTCVEFVKDVQKDIEKWGRDTGLIVEVERSGYLLVMDRDGENYKKKVVKEKQIQEREKLKHEKSQLKAEKSQLKAEKSQLKTNKVQKVEHKHQHKEKHEKMIPEQPQQATNPIFELNISSNEITFGPLLIQIVPAQVTTQSWRMYQRYCEQIHQKPQKSQSSYSSFLCQKALNFLLQKTTQPCTQTYIPSWQSSPDSHPPPGQTPTGTRTKLLGCYHMKYYIQKQLIGVGVVDILPHGLSSVYFFYQPKYNDFRLGVFSSLVQIEYVRWLSLSFPEFQYYYMGFYIQNSSKMEYKGNYEKFCLLCPVKYAWVEVNQEIRDRIGMIEKDSKMDVMLAPASQQLCEDMKFTDVGVYITQNCKFKYQGKQLKLKQLNPRIMIPVIGMLRDMALVWGKRIFEGFTFTF